MGRQIKTIYGNQWKSDKDEKKEDLIILFAGMFFVIIMLLIN